MTTSSTSTLTSSAEGRLLDPSDYIQQRGVLHWAEDYPLTSMIDTSRLVLRLAVESDVPELVRYQRENAAHLARWSPLSSAGVLSAEHWEDQGFAPARRV